MWATRGLIGNTTRTQQGLGQVCVCVNDTHIIVAFCSNAPWSLLCSIDGEANTQRSLHTEEAFRSYTLAAYSDGLCGASATRQRHCADDPTSPAHPKAVDEPEVWRASVRRIAKAKSQANEYKTKARAELEPDDQNDVPTTAKCKWKRPNKESRITGNVNQSSSAV